MLLAVNLAPNPEIVHHLERRRGDLSITYIYMYVCTYFAFYLSFYLYIYIHTYVAPAG